MSICADLILRLSNSFTLDAINYRLERDGAYNLAYRLGRTFPGYLTDKTSIVFGMRGEDGLVLKLNGAGTEFVMSLNNPDQNPSIKRGMLKNLGFLLK